jgi:alpha-beta hydrolase superfamily lysophospholipase
MMPEITPTVETYTAGDGYEWRYRRFLPLQKLAVAQVVCIHGIQSHGGWYEHSCSRLAERGFRVDFLDRRGSGMNEQDRGDAPSFRRLLDDLGEYIESVRNSTERLATHHAPPTFLVGISWGAKLATALQRRYPGLVDGLVLLCPGFFAQVKPPLKDRLRILWARLVSCKRLFPIPLNDPELFTANRLRQQFIRNDALGLRQATARFLIESVRLDGYLRFMPKHVTVPVLLMLAERDRIIHNDRTRTFVHTFAAKDREVIEYVGAHHTLEFEVDPEPFIRDLGDWLERHLLRPVN